MFGMGTLAYDRWTEEIVTILAGAQPENFRTVQWRNGDIAVIGISNLGTFA